MNWEFFICARVINKFPIRLCTHNALREGGREREGFWKIVNFLIWSRQGLGALHFCPLDTDILAQINVECKSSLSLSHPRMATSTFARERKKKNAIFTTLIYFKCVRKTLSLVGATSQNNFVNYWQAISCERELMIAVARAKKKSYFIPVQRAIKIEIFFLKKYFAILSK